MGEMGSKSVRRGRLPDSVAHRPNPRNRGALKFGEIVPKFGGRAVNAQVTARASTFCKSAGRIPTQFESCTCHRCDVARHRKLPNPHCGGSGVVISGAVLGLGWSTGVLVEILLWQGAILSARDGRSSVASFSAPTTGWV